MLTDFLTHFHFLRPNWLLALLPLLALMAVLKRYPKNRADWEGVIAPHLFAQLFPEAKMKSNGKSLTYTLIGALVLGVVAAAGPTFQKLPQPVYSVNQGHVVVLDMSLSMRSTDIAPDRITRAKYKAIDLIKQINEGEIGVVAYAGDAFTISPLTEDINTLETLIPSLSPEIMPMPGSDAYLGLTHAAELLLQAGYPNGTIYWITDGIDLSESPEIAEWINNNSFQVNVLAVGTQAGAPIKLSNGELLKDNTGNIVIPKLSFRPVAALAKQSGGNATLLTSDEKDIESLTRSVLPPDAAENEESDNLIGGDQWRELGPLLVAIALPFAAFIFRKGVISLLVIGFFGAYLSPPPAFAQDETALAQNLERAQTAQNNANTDSAIDSALGRVANWFKNADQRGLDAYQKGEYSSASDTFKDAMWQGSAKYREGDYEGAIEAFDTIDSAESWYNKGNAFAKLGKLDEAIAAYEQALERTPDMTQAAENKALIEQLKEQQQNQESEQGQQNEQQQNSQQEDSSQQSESGQSEDEEQNSGQQQNNDSQNSQSESGQESDNAKNQGAENQGAENQASQNNQSQNNQNQTENSAQQNQTQEQQQNAPFDEQALEQQKQNAQEQGTDPLSDEDTAQQASQMIQQGDESKDGEQQAAIQNMQPNEASMTDEEREKQQKIDALLRRIPNDPAYLLQRKMQLEAQKRARERRQITKEKQW